MTLTQSAAAEADTVERGGVPGARRWTVSASAPESAWPFGYRRVLAASLGVLSVLALSFPLFVGVVSPLQEHRAQVVAYVRLRNALALGTQPVAAPIPAGTPVALLQIPSLGVSDVVLEGTTSGTLMGGPGHLRTSVLPGQAGVSVIFGRRAAFGGPFGRLSSLRRGAEVRTTTGQGTARYLVTGVSAASAAGTIGVGPAAPGAGAGRLILVTAGGRDFLPAGADVVQATLQPGGAAAAAAGAPFPAAAPLAVIGRGEGVLGGDTAATVPLALWSQLLLITAVGLSVAWVRLGRPSTWLVGVPVVLAVGWHVAEAAVRLLPNLL